jgi:hypothetical protein
MKMNISPEPLQQKVTFGKGKDRFVILQNTDKKIRSVENM